MATTESLMTAEEYLLAPDNGQPTELVRGRTIMMNMPGYYPGKICVKLSFHLQMYLESHSICEGASNDSGILTERNPDTVRGADVAYYSYEKVPRGTNPLGYPGAIPELVFEVRSPTDRRSEILEKVAEYLTAGVIAVCVVDPADQTITVYRQDRAAVTVTSDQELTGFDFLPGFSVPLRKLFE